MDFKKAVLFMIISTFSFALMNVSVKYLERIQKFQIVFFRCFAVFVLREKLKNIKWLFFLTAFAGVLVLKGLDGNINTIGLTLILTASVFSGMVYVVIRKIGVSDHPAVVVNYFMFVGTVIGGLLAIAVWVWPMGYEWMFLFLLGVFGFMGQLYMTKAFQIAKTNLVAPLKYIEVIFTISIGVLWFNESYTIYSFIGLFLIISALVLNTLVKKD